MRHSAVSDRRWTHADPPVSLHSRHMHSNVQTYVVGMDQLFAQAGMRVKMNQGYKSQGVGTVESVLNKLSCSVRWDNGKLEECLFTGMHNMFQLKKEEGGRKQPVHTAGDVLAPHSMHLRQSSISPPVPDQSADGRSWLRADEHAARRAMPSVPLKFSGPLRPSSTGEDTFRSPCVSVAVLQGGGKSAERGRSMSPRSPTPRVLAVTPPRRRSHERAPSSSRQGQRTLGSSEEQDNDESKRMRHARVFERWRNEQPCYFSESNPLATPCAAETKFLGVSLSDTECSGNVTRIQDTKEFQLVSSMSADSSFLESPAASSVTPAPIGELSKITKRDRWSVVQVRPDFKLLCL